MAKRKIKVRTGDIFSVEVSKNEFIFGRVLFDVVNQYMERGFDKEINNYMGFFNKCFLIETFVGVHPSFESIDIKEKAVISSFVSKDFFEDNDFECNIIHNIKIDAKKVSFPEVLSLINSNYFFSVGELQIPISLTKEEYERIKVNPCFGSGYWDIVATLDLSGRTDLIEDGDQMDNYFRYSDIRSLPDIRKIIYSRIGEDLNQSYYELALKNDFDLARLY